MIPEDEAREEPGVDEPPPVGRSWRALYLVVLLHLAALIVLFTVFTRAFS